MRFYRFLKIRNSRDAFSLMEVVIAMVIATLVITLIVKALSDAASESRRLTQRNDYNSLVNEIQTVLNSADTCLNSIKLPTPGAVFTLPTTPPSPFVPIPITLQVRSTTTYAQDTDYGAITIKSLEISDMKPGLSATEFEVPITLVVTRKGATGVSATNDFKPQVFNVVLGIDPLDATNPGKVVRCSASIPSFWVKADLPIPLPTPAPPATQVNIAYMRGAVGIGTLNPKDNLDVVGSLYGTKIFYNTIAGPSDIKLKENIRPLKNSLEKLLSLHGVLFDWKDRSKPQYRDNIGLIAQDVEKVFPELVQEHPTRGFKTVEYDKLIAPLVEALKEQHEIILKQQKEIDEIKKALKNK